MNILICLPNWLGDLVMSTAFVQAVKEQFPGAGIDLITKKGIDVLLDNFPPHQKKYVFSKQEYKGLKGVWQFGREIAIKKKYDLFFCLRESFSSALMGYATGATKRIGYRNEFRSVFFTHSFKKKKQQHHVEEYLRLLQLFIKQKVSETPVSLTVPSPVRKRDAIIININSEAQARRWPKEKAISIISSIRQNISQEIILIGSEKEKDFVDSVFEALPDKINITNLSGKSPLPFLVTLMSSCRMVLSTESGPAQIANAVNTPTLITLGASNELISTPSPNSHISVIRHGKLPCEPCLKNTCQLFPKPECLLRLDETRLVEKVKAILNQP